jgi:hypothetical protein
MIRLPAKGRLATHAYASKLEERYAQHLSLLQRAGEIHAFWPQPFGLRLAPKTFYHPDFLIQLTDGLLEIHETKGYWEDDARAKWKIAATLYPCFAFVAIQWVKGAWVEERL